MCSSGPGADTRAPGTPVKQLFKQHRIHSPLHEIDGHDDARNADSSGAPSGRQVQVAADLTAVAPVGIGDLSNEPLTAGVLERILNSQLAPIRKEIMAIKTHGVSQEDLNNAFGPLKNDFDDLTKRIGLLKSQIHLSQHLQGHLKHLWIQLRSRKYSN